MQYGFYFDSDACVGCKACAMACKDKNDMPLGVKLRKVVDYASGRWDVSGPVPKASKVFGYSISISCMHCGNPACVANCPTAAMTKDPDTGIVTTDHGRCIGCGSCRIACPYDAPRIHPEKRYAVKCDFCRDSLASGGNPACVDACIMRCLKYGDIDELRAEHGDSSDIVPLASSSLTRPSFVVAESRLIKDGIEEGCVTNAAEELR